MASKSAIFQAFSFSTDPDPQLQGFTTNSMSQIGGAAIRQEMQALGYDDPGRILLGDNDLTTGYADFARQLDASISSTYNEMLQNQIDKLPDGISIEQARAELQPFFNSVSAYNQSTLIPYTSATARQQALSSFYQNNVSPATGKSLADSVQWTWTQATDYDDDCAAAEAASPASYDELVGIAGDEPPAHPNCLLAGTVVAGPLVNATFERAYQGPIVTIRTALGNELAGTPNHPVLTPEGWIALGALSEGDDVLACVDVGRMTTLLVDPDEHQIPALIEEVGRSRSVALLQMPGSAADFHGDGIADSKVNVVLPDSFFRNNLQSAHYSEHDLELVRGNAAIGLPAFHAQRAAVQVGIRSLRTSNGSVGSGSVGPALLGRFSGSDELSRFASSPRGDSASEESLSKNVTADAQRLADRLLAFPAQITTDRIVQIRNNRARWSGPVYNLSTSEGWYSANNLIVSNCGCSMDADDPAPEDLPAAEDLWTGQADSSESFADVLTEKKGAKSVTVAFDLDDTALQFPEVLVPLAWGYAKLGAKIGVLTGNHTDAAEKQWEKLGYPPTDFYEIHGHSTGDPLARWKAQMCRKYGEKGKTVLIDDFKHGKIAANFVKHDRGWTLPLQILLPPGAPTQRFGIESVAEQQIVRQSNVKYHVPTERASDILDVISGLLKPDQYDPGFVGQDVRSDYFDAPDRALLAAKRADTNYVTVRLRHYGNGEASYLEAKTGDAKYRVPCELSVGDITVAIASALIPEVAERLALLCAGQEIMPAAAVWYRRFARRGDAGSITLDFDLQSAAKSYDGAILEVKSERGSFELPAIDALGLQVIDFSKYEWAMDT